MYSGMEDLYPSYSPDGQKIVFASFRSGNQEIWIFDKDGKNPFQVTHLAPAYGRAPRWAPDNKTIVFHSFGDICTIYSNGSNFKRLTNIAADDRRASFSRDGNWIYFESNRSGSYNIWKIPASGGEAVQITKDGGRRPLESPDGVWLYFSKMINNRVSIVKISVKGGPETIVLQYRDRISSPYEFYGIYDWMPFDDGIYFQEWEKKGQGTLKFFEFETGTTNTLVYLNVKYYAINISPDRRYLLYCHSVLESNVIMVENWR
jgi:Tol biopolymer transport system component